MVRETSPCLLRRAPGSRNSTDYARDGVSRVLQGTFSTRACGRGDQTRLAQADHFPNISHTSTANRSRHGVWERWRMRHHPGISQISPGGDTTRAIKLEKALTR